MEKKINFMVSGGSSDVVYREGKALELKEPLRVQIDGNIDAPKRWLEQRIEGINQKATHIKVNEDDKTITLVIDENNYYKTVIIGQLLMSKEYNKFKLNSGEYITNFEMADLIRMSRASFANKDVAIRLTSDLRNFKAKIDGEIEKSDNARGDTRLLRAQTVESNLPKSFELMIPVFKGLPAKSIAVEVDIRADDLACTLVSPHAQEVVDTIVKDIIKDELSAIEKIAPDIVVIFV